MKRAISDKAAKLLVDAFYESEDLSIAFEKAIVERQVSPATIAFALLVIDRSIGSQIKDWADVKTLARTAWDVMDEAGDLAPFGADRV